MLRRLGSLAFIAGAATCAWVAPANAATVGVTEAYGPYGSDYEAYVEYDAAPGEANDVTASGSSGGRVVRITDSRATLQVRPTNEAGACTSLSDHEAVCNVTSVFSPFQPGTPTHLYGPDFELGDGTNHFRVSPSSPDVWFVVNGGPGDDTIDVSGALTGSINGGWGNDRVSLGANKEPGFIQWSGPDTRVDVHNGLDGDNVWCYAFPRVKSDAGDVLHGDCGS